MDRERLIGWLRAYADSHEGVAAHRDIMRRAADALTSFDAAAVVPASEVYLCRAAGEGSHNFRVCANESGVMAFYEEMFGKDQDGWLDSAIAHFRDADNWGNCGTAYSCELYCATLEVWKVDPRELAFAQSATVRWEEVERRSIGLQPAIRPGEPCYAFEGGKWYRLQTPPLLDRPEDGPNVASDERRPGRHPRPPELHLQEHRGPSSLRRHAHRR